MINLDIWNRLMFPIVIANLFEYTNIPNLKCVKF